MKLRDLWPVALIGLTLVFFAGYLGVDKMREFQEKAKSAEAYAASQGVIIDSLKKHKQTVILRVPVAAPPDTCTPWVEPQREAILTLEEALARALASRDTLGSALAARPKSATRFVRPNVGVGAFVGVCGINQLCAGFGLTFNLGGIRP